MTIDHNFIERMLSTDECDPRVKPIKVISNKVIGLTEVRCCCHPENLIGFLPTEVTDYELRELDDGTFAFDSNDEEDEIRQRTDFIPYNGPKLPKTWRKTWRK